MNALVVERAGPGVTIQDDGRPGWRALGLSRGGAVDGLALAEGAALLGQPPGTALEMAGMGGRFRAEAALRVALTGAPMRAVLDGRPLTWHASHALPEGSVLEIGGALSGAYGYLTPGGGIATPTLLGARSAHLAAGLGAPLAAGDRLPLGPDREGEAGLTLEPAARFAGGEIRILPSLQTALYPRAERARFEATGFVRDVRANRMGVRLKPPEAGFALQAGGTILSEVIVPGDIQIPGDGAPFVLLSECQTTGGYPRIGTVIPADLPRIAQAPGGAEIRFRFVTRDEALAAECGMRDRIAALPGALRPLIRDPGDIPDLLRYTLISGVTTGG